MISVYITVRMDVDSEDAEKASTLAEQLIENATQDWLDSPRVLSTEVLNVEV